MPSLDLSTAQHHASITELTDLLCARTLKQERSFFQAEIAYFLGKMAATMRAYVRTKDRGVMPVNIYAINLAPSGFGKGMSMGIMENEVLKGFKARFFEDTLPVLAEQGLWQIANQRAARNGTDQQEEFNKVQGEYRACGGYLFTFDSGSTPAVKQMHQKLQMADAGSINLQIDEIGSNLVGQVEVLNTFLELYDTGRINQKLKMNTVDQQRGEQLDGSAPANMLLFGAPAKLFDGSTTENEFYSMLEIGYARRCIFGLGTKGITVDERTAEEIYQARSNPVNTSALTKWAQVFYQLADPAIHNWEMEMPDDVGIALTQYQLDCEKIAKDLPEYDEIRRIELSHRHSKALKLAGAFAFVDSSTEVEMDHLLSAIKLVEESGEAFSGILSREKAHVRLAKYLAQVGTDQTHSDIHEQLPFYPKGNAPRNDMMMLATGWGYRNNVIIKKSFIDGIEFFRGESLEETDLEKLIVSYSNHWAYEYQLETAPFDKLHLLMQQDGYHWANHHFDKGHRAEENVIPGFNLLVLDVDEGTSLGMVHELMKDYKFLTHTTKRHQTAGHGDRFRMVLPINYTLKLDNDEYKQMMRSIFEALPFKTDESYEKREKKSETFAGCQLHYNMEGELFDILPFIPKTSRYEQQQKTNQQLASLDNLERWFAQRISNGNRNNQMIKYALCLVDSGWDLASVSRQVHDFNKKLQDPMSEHEIDSTILVTVAKTVQQLQQQQAS